MGATAIDSPHRCRCVFFSLFPPHLGEWVGFLGPFVCFSCIFWSVGVCVECVFPQVILLIIEKKLYSSTNCDSKNASPTLVENLHSLHGLLKNYYLVTQKIVASFKDQREYHCNQKCHIIVVQMPVD